MALDDRDPHTGYLTTGHDWNGIKELNTPVPRAVFVFLAIGALFSLICWLLLPAFPLGTTYTKGLLGTDQRLAVAEALEEGTRLRTPWLTRLDRADYAAIQADPQLMTRVRQVGRTLFGDNCAVCHGRTAQGGDGFPNLTTNGWLWGGDPATIAETIRVGINSGHPDSRVSQMPAFGREQTLPRDAVESVAAYVRALSANKPADLPADKVAAGKAVFVANCVACHGESARGNREVGAPGLVDHAWIYGGSYPAIFTTVWGGRQGRMPSWEARLSATERKILALYLVDLRAPKP
ncbi:MAG: cytochrome-c oxidase, cbb3-type subunit III [Alphaproteobacteria bacterium]|nr:cytochrome-c oxidase, cbb3-type subunit III [Alphaproteobacteria bacterium]